MLWCSFAARCSLIWRRRVLRVVVFPLHGYIVEEELTSIHKVDVLRRRMTRVLMLSLGCVRALSI